MAFQLDTPLSVPGRLPTQRTRRLHRGRPGGTPKGLAPDTPAVLCHKGMDPMPLMNEDFSKEVDRGPYEDISR